MDQVIKPLSVHPLPKSDESVGKWIERLASTNRISFKLMLLHIVGFAKKVSFLEVLVALTRVPLEQIQQMPNEFKSGFWKNLLVCPTKGCNHFSPTLTEAFYHIQQAHFLGVQWFYCPFCSYKTKYRARLRKNHFRYQHQFTSAHPVNCPLCNYMGEDSADLIYHLNEAHSEKGQWYGCQFCDLVTMEKDKMNQHLIEWHRIHVKRYYL